MMGKITVSEAIVVEGRYDKIKISGIFDTLVIETGGFRIFDDKAKLNLLRELAEKRGIIVFTDSDGAGLIIRNYIKGAVTKGTVKHAYIPQIKGKEKRKSAPSKAGTLGVEGIDDELIKSIILGAATEKTDFRRDKAVTKLTLYEDGLSGGKDSAEKRRKLLAHLGAPDNLSANALCEIINSFMSYEEYKKMLDTVLK